MENNQLANIPEGKGTDLLDLNMKQIFYLGEAMAQAGMLKGPQAAGQAAVKIMAGQALKIDPVSAMRGMFIMPSGSIGFYSKLIAARIKESPKYDYRVDALTEEICTITFYEIIQGKRTVLGSESFSQADAKRQGTQNMAKFPKNMLFARAMGNGAGFYCPDVMGNHVIETEADREIIEANTTPIPPTPEEQAAEDARIKAALNRDKKLKPKPEPEHDEGVVVDPDVNETPQTIDEPDTDVHESEPVADENGFVPHTDAQRRKAMAVLGSLGFKTDTEKRQVVAGVLSLENLVSFKDLSFSEVHTLIEKLADAEQSPDGAKILREFFVTKDEADA